MRITSCTGSIEENVWKVNLLLIPCLLLFLLSSCATTGARYKRIPPKGVEAQKIEHERVPETGVKKEIIRSEPKKLTLAETPKARAAAKLIEDGRRQLSTENAESAERSFQEAINIDPGNGIAYYYLARAKYEIGAFEQAQGVLDKAEELLAGSKEWMEAIETLRGMIKEKL